MIVLFVIFLIILLNYSYKLKEDFVLLARILFGVESDVSKSASDSNENVENELADVKRDLSSFERWRRVLDGFWLTGAIIIVLAFCLFFGFQTQNSLMDAPGFSFELLMEPMYLLFVLAPPLLPILGVCVLGRYSHRAIQKAADVWRIVGSQRNELYQYGFPSDESLKRTFYNSILAVGLVFIALTAFLIGAFLLDVDKYSIYSIGYVPVLALKFMAGWLLACLMVTGLWKNRVNDMEKALAQSDLFVVSLRKNEKVENRKNVLILVYLALLFFGIGWVMPDPVLMGIDGLLKQFLNADSISANGETISFYFTTIINVIFDVVFVLSFLIFLHQIYMPSDFSSSDSKRKGEPLSTVLIAVTVLELIFLIIVIFGVRLFADIPVGGGIINVVYLLYRFGFSFFYSIVGLICIHLQLLSQKPRKALNALAIALTLVVIALPF
ncbi:MAG: hypothetical protein IJG38_14445 [Thermoguttaceae bacterium]|nr:hypothetical protein [Thermoguttaceae bacterium]MBQ6616577.1 hypothetical protein [Thermoguttaceae bacterium]